MFAAVDPYRGDEQGSGRDRSRLVGQRDPGHLHGGDRYVPAASGCPRSDRSKEDRHEGMGAVGNRFDHHRSSHGCGAGYREQHEPSQVAGPGDRPG